MARQTRPHHHRAGFAAGVVAGALLTAIMLVLGRQFGLFSLPELLGYRLIALLPLPLFSFFTATLGGGAKQLLFLGAVLGQVLVAGALGALWAAGAATLPGEEWPRRRLPALWRPGAGGGLLFALPLTLVVAFVLLPLLGGGPLGSELASGPLANGLAAAGLAALYGLTLAPLYRRFMTSAGVGARPATGAPPLSPTS
jgi:hypothetical protein